MMDVEQPCQISRFLVASTIQSSIAHTVVCSWKCTVRRHITHVYVLPCCVVLCGVVFETFAPHTHPPPACPPP